MRIALDVDGVLADAMTPWAKAYIRIHGKPLSKSDMAGWNFWADIGLTRSEFFRIFSEIWRDWAHIPPTESGLAEKVEALNHLGGVDIVTGRTPDTFDYVKRWLLFHKIPYRRFVTVPHPVAKAQLNYDVYIDDAPQVVASVSEQESCVILYDQPWNRCVREGPRIFRVHSLAEATAIVDRLKRQGLP